MNEAGTYPRTLMAAVALAAGVSGENKSPLRMTIPASFPVGCFLPEMDVGHASPADIAAGRYRPSPCHVKGRSASIADQRSIDRNGTDPAPTRAEQLKQSNARKLDLQQRFDRSRGRLVPLSPFSL